MPFPLECVENFEAGKTSLRKYSPGQKGTACSLHFAFHLKSALQIDSLGQGEGQAVLPEGSLQSTQISFILFLRF